MEAQLHHIATNAGHVLFNPTVLAVSAAAALILVTGVAGRVVAVVEDFLHFQP